MGKDVLLSGAGDSNVMYADRAERNCREFPGRHSVSITLTNVDVVFYKKTSKFA